MDTKLVLIAILLIGSISFIGGVVWTSQTPTENDTGVLQLQTLHLDDDRFAVDSNTTLTIILNNTAPTPTAYNVYLSYTLECLDPSTMEPVHTVEGFVDDMKTIALMVRARTIRGSEEEFIIRADLYVVNNDVESLVDTKNVTLTVTLV